MNERRPLTAEIQPKGGDLATVSVVIHEPEERKKWKPFFLLREKQLLPEQAADADARNMARNVVGQALFSLARGEEVRTFTTHVPAPDGRNDYEATFISTDVERERLDKLRRTMEELIGNLKDTFANNNLYRSLSDNWPEVHFIDQEAA